MKKGSWGEAIFYTISVIILLVVQIYDISVNYSYKEKYVLSWEAILFILFSVMLTYLIISSISEHIEKRKKKNKNNNTFTTKKKKKKWKKKR